MSKLIYVYGDDNKLLDTLVTALRANGYALEYANLVDGQDLGNVKADISLACTQTQPHNRLSLGGLTLDLDNISVVGEDGCPMHFTPTEFALLGYLIKNASRAVSREELLTAVWRFETDSATRVADDTVKRLRRKLADTRVRVETVWGFGFKAVEVAS